MSVSSPSLSVATHTSGQSHSAWLSENCAVFTRPLLPTSSLPTHSPLTNYISDLLISHLPRHYRSYDWIVLPKWLCGLSNGTGPKNLTKSNMAKYWCQDEHSPLIRAGCCNDCLADERRKLLLFRTTYNLCILLCLCSWAIIDFYKVCYWLEVKWIELSVFLFSLWAKQSSELFHRDRTTRWPQTRSDLHTAFG